MKKFLLIASAVMAACACSQKWNDLVHEEVVAEITAFEVEGQLSSSISKARKTAVVTVPEGTDLSALKITAFAYTPEATASRSVSVGDVIDLSSHVIIMLSTYDEYVWTLSAEIGKETEPEPDKPREGPQLYNMGFDLWSQEETGHTDVCYGEDATEEQKLTWGSANMTTAILGLPTVIKETSFLAVPGDGKAAVLLKTQDLAGTMLAAGSIFNGKVGKLDIFKMSAQLHWGIPFTERPAALEGYACYKPQLINIAKEPYMSKKGQLDNGHIFILLTDWAEPFVVDPPESLVDFDNDPAIIGYGKLVFDKEMTAYEKFRIDIKYRNERKPKYIVIVASSSSLGDHFTGASGSLLYLDEFSLAY